MVLPKIAPEALVELDLTHVRPAGAVGMYMNNVGVGAEHDVETCVPDTAAEIHFLGIHKKAFIEPANAPKEVAADH